MFVAGEAEADVFGTVSGHLDFLSRFSASDGHVVHITHPGFWFGFAPPQEVPLTQAELAAMSNVSRNTLGTILRSLQADAASPRSTRCSHAATLTHQVPA